MGKTTDQTELTEAANGDLFDIVDVSDTTDDPQGSSRKISIANILWAAGIKVVSGYEGYLIIRADGNQDRTIVQTNDILIGKGAYYNGNYVMMRALQDSPTQDSEFETGYSAAE